MPWGPWIPTFARKSGWWKSIPRVALHAKDVARLGWRGHGVAQDFDDVRGLLHQRGVARRELALLQIQVVLEPDAYVAAEQHGLRDHRELVQRNPEREPRGGRRQQIAHVGHGFRRRRLAPGNAEADLE